LSPTSQTILISILCLGLILALVSYLYARRSSSATASLREEIKDLEQKAQHALKEKEAQENEKAKLEEKNKKVWQMSEAVYKEKKKVDEENEKLTVEKEKLETEKKKVDEKVKKLWNQSTAIHKEKERINELKLVVEHKHQEVIDSVNYAKRIQEAILPDLKEVNASLPQSFILFKPKDIVAGDFYWFGKPEGSNEAIIASVDCTGHGVPGAFMSMIGNTLLNQVVFERKITEPNQVLTALNEEVNRALKQTQADSESRDGMDIAICSFDLDKPEMHYSGAMRPLYFIRNGELAETKASKFPIGGQSYNVEKVYVNHVIPLQKGDTIYISTDGYADQFSPDDKKLMTRKFKEILLSIQDKTMEEQKQFLNEYIENWKGSMEQTDDILVIGIRI
jgi:sigma-B regulation protein RsbU (phosphoserine phosphatase)